MKVYDEISLANFKAWAGADDNLTALTYDDCKQLEAVLEDIYPDGIDATGLNDILRFDFNWCAHSIGYRNEMAVFNGNDRDSYAEHYGKILAEKFPAYADYVADYVADYLDDLTDEDENEDRSEDRDDEAIQAFYRYLKTTPEEFGAIPADIVREFEGDKEARLYTEMAQAHPEVYFSDGGKKEN